MRDLVPRHKVRLVYPIARNLWIVKLPENDGGSPSRRKSPKHPKVVDVFEGLVSFPELITQENFQIDVVVTEEEELRSYDRRKRWRRHGWATVERRLLEVFETVSLQSAADFMALIPADLPAEFRTSDIANAVGRPRQLAQKMAYCLRNCGLIRQVGSEGNSITYSRVAG